MLSLMKTFMHINVYSTEHNYNHPLEVKDNYDNDDDENTNTY